MIAVAAWQEPAVVYVAAAFLAAVSAASELVGRFKDAPVHVLATLPGLFYLLLNAALAVVVLWLLRIGSLPVSGPSAVEQVILAGFGARIIVRTKVVGYRSKDGTTMDLGPGAVFEKVLATISRAADRNRAADRVDLVRPLLDGVRYADARRFFVNEMAAAMQDLTDEEKQQINKNLDLIDSRTDVDEGTRVDLLAYLVLDYAGPEFLQKLVELYRKRFPEPLPPSEPVVTVPEPVAGPTSATGG
ncbi:MAG TPA: hypothetical protein VGH10_10545 [Actinomycetota bacterium]